MLPLRQWATPKLLRVASAATILPTFYWRLRGKQRRLAYREALDLKAAEGSAAGICGAQGNHPAAV